MHFYLQACESTIMQTCVLKTELNHGSKNWWTGPVTDSNKSPNWLEKEIGQRIRKPVKNWQANGLLWVNEKYLI